MIVAKLTQTKPYTTPSQHIVTRVSFKYFKCFK